MRVIAACVAVLVALSFASKYLTADPRPPRPLDVSEIRLALEKLEVTGSALYVAAHPDDENTALIAYLSMGRKVRTGYLSMTRGDGGQNVIGSDLGERLGVLRTQELLGARRIDGGEQFFTRALDFGFSKNPQETMEKWGHDRILADVVWVIRRFRPDVIITRFATDGSGGHGHHTASALLAEEAYTAAADSSRFRDQLRWVRTWKAKRLVWNAYRFGGAGPDTTSGRLHVDLGANNALLGRSYTEIAGESRSMHKSQGFGAAERRGTWENTFEHRLGDRATSDLFEGVDLTWSRVRGADRIPALLDRAERGLDPDRPEIVLPPLLQAWDVLSKLPLDPIVERKREEMLGVIRACSGLWVEAIASRHLVSSGSSLRMTVSALASRSVGAEIRSVTILASGGHLTLADERPGWKLARNVTRIDTLDVTLPAQMPASTPYWLERRPQGGAFDVQDQFKIGEPENDPPLVARFTVDILGHVLRFDVPVVYRWVDPVQGERYRDLVVAPPAMMRFDRAAYLFPDRKPRIVRVNVQSADRAVAGALQLRLPAGWQSEPRSLSVALRGNEADTTIQFRVIPPQKATAASIGAEFTTGGIVCNSQLVRLDYPHVPIQTLLPPAEARVVRSDIESGHGRIGYVMGSGDQGPQALEQMGYEVRLLSDEELENGDLSQFPTIVVGVRAYNTRPRLLALEPRLLQWVSKGGRLVVQYNTAEDGLQDRIGPYPLRISRDRVTVEEAPIKLLAPKSALLSRPQKIGAADFEGWVQERGLYFARPWSTKYDSLLASNDPGETPKAGSLLYARYGKGDFIYTGLAFFRQLPAGVPGAWRLFANLVSHRR